MCICGPVVWDRQQCWDWDQQDEVHRCRNFYLLTSEGQGKPLGAAGAQGGVGRGGKWRHGFLGGVGTCMMQAWTGLKFLLLFW